VKIARVQGTVNAPRALTADERTEMEALGVSLDRPAMERPRPGRRRPSVPRTIVRAPDVLNEATDYRPQTVSFSRGLRVPIGSGRSLLLLSGTASVDEEGATIHAGDFRAQCWRTLRNLTRLLESEGASWHDVVRTTCYIRDIERDYADFNDVRTWFYRALALDPMPASTGIQARICRADLLVEIEAMAVVRDARRGRRP